MSSSSSSSRGDWKSKRVSEEVLRECAGEGILDYFQVSKEWTNHKEKIYPLSTTTVEVCITSLNLHSGLQGIRHKVLWLNSRVELSFFYGDASSIGDCIEEVKIFLAKF